MKKPQAKPGSALRRIAIVAGLFLLVQPRPGIIHVVGFVAFVFWLLHQAGCCWKCVFCSLTRDLAALGVKRFRRERRKESPLFERMYAFAYSVTCRSLQAHLKETFHFHRSSELLLRRTIPVRMDGYWAESGMPCGFEGMPPREQSYLHRVTYKTPPEGEA